METVDVTLSRGDLVPSIFIIRDEAEGGAVLLTDAELRAVVQSAYDQFGILAAPSYEVEAVRSLEAEAEGVDALAADPLAMIHDHVNRAHEQQERNRSGARALGASAVHGVDL